MPKPFIETKLTQLVQLYKTPLQVLENLFATLGTGLDATTFGLGRNQYYMDFDIWTPVIPIKFVYPFSINERFQPYQQYIGLDGVYGNFKEAMDYFLKCIEITDPDEYVLGFKPKDLQGLGGTKAVRNEIIQWQDYVPVIRQMYGII